MAGTYSRSGLEDVTAERLGIGASNMVVSATVSVAIIIRAALLEMHVVSSQKYCHPPQNLELVLETFFDCCF